MAAARPKRPSPWCGAWRSRWPDEDVAATLNRMGMPTGQRKTWTAHRVSSLRRVYGIPDYHSAEKNGEWLTMSEAATTFAVTQHRIRRLIKDGILPAEQVMPGAPYQIRASAPRTRHRCDRPKRHPVSRRSGKPTCNVYRRLKKRGTMNGS